MDTVLWPIAVAALTGLAVVSLIGFRVARLGAQLGRQKAEREEILGLESPLTSNGRGLARDALWDDPSIWSEEAEQAFTRARRRADREASAGRRSGQTVTLDLFEHAIDGLGVLSPNDPERQPVSISKIVGSVDKPGSFTRSFNPTDEALRARWKKVYAVTHGLRGYEPVSLYQVGDAYFVVDGHYRISVIASLGGKTIMAEVREWR
jgi:hypothetical protein